MIYVVDRPNQFLSTTIPLWLLLSLLLSGTDAFGYIACTGTNFALRAQPLREVNWFPTESVTGETVGGGGAGHTQRHSLLVVLRVLVTIIFIISQHVLVYFLSRPLISPFSPPPCCLGVTLTVCCCCCCCHTFSLPPEDYALGFNLKINESKGSYLNEYLVYGEAPEEVREIFQQRSRWCKGQMQVWGTELAAFT